MQNNVFSCTSIILSIDNSDDTADGTGREARVDAAWVLENNHKQQPPQLSSAEFWPGWKPTTEVRGLCLESFLRQHLLHRERRRAVSYLLLLLLVL